MDRTRYWILIVLATLSLILVGVNIVMVDRNRSLQADISSRNLYIQQSLQLENIYQPLLRSLAELTVRHNDTQLRALLAAQGITVNATVAPQQSVAAQSTSESQSGE